MYITHARLLEVLDYDQDTGIFTRKIGLGHSKAGDTAGSPAGRGYIRVKVDGMAYKAHRLAWFYVTISWPKEQIDHVNGIRDDNRFANLREANQFENSRNARKYKNNSTGFKGVSVEKGKFVSRIAVGGSQRIIGRFSTPEAAHTAYREAARRHYGSFAKFS